MPRARVEVPTQRCLRREAFGDANADVLETDLMEKARRSLAAVTAVMAAEKSAGISRRNIHFLELCFETAKSHLLR